MATAVRRSLTCLSPDGLACHSVDLSKFPEKVQIITHFLPIENGGEKEEDKSSAYTYRDIGYEETLKDSPKIIETDLPRRITSSLEMDPLIEILCVDNNTLWDNGSKSTTQKQSKKNQLPLLALYNRSSLWLISISYPTEGTTIDNQPQSSSGIIKGKILSVNEPFEETLLSASASAYIVRARAFPSSQHSPRVMNSGSTSSVAFTSIAPPGSIAILTSNGHVVLNHVKSILTEKNQKALSSSRQRFGFTDSDSEDDDDYGFEKIQKSDATPIYHTTTPLDITSGGVGYGGASEILNLKENPITDFCFGTSSHDLFCIYILVKSGDIYGANPILFDGTAVPRNVVKQRLNSLEDKLSEYEKINESFDLGSEKEEKEEDIAEIAELVRSFDYIVAQKARIKSEIQYLTDSFPDVMNGSEYYVVACTHGRAHVSSGSHWPVQLQGPLLYGRLSYEENDHSVVCGSALAIQSIYVSTPNSIPENKLSFLAVARRNGQVDLCGISRELEVRFAYESTDDLFLLNSRVVRSGALLETVCFDFKKKINSTDTDTGSSSQLVPFKNTGRNQSDMLSLVVDSVVSSHNEQLIHCISDSGVFSISSCAILETLQNIFTPSEMKKVSNTMAWSSIATGDNIHMEGAVVSGDPSLGHILVGRTSAGSMETVNLSAAQYLYRGSSILDTEKEENMKNSKSTQGDDSSTKSFARTVSPLLDKVREGLSSTGKLTTDGIYPKDANPSTVAFVTSTLKKLETDIAIPLNQLHSETEMHREKIEKSYESQVKRMETLKKMVEKAKQNHESYNKKLNKVEKNATLLAQRSAAILSACRNSKPTCSRAEQDYFNQLKKWENQINKWDERHDVLQKKATNFFVEKEADDGSRRVRNCKLVLPENDIKLCNDLLFGTGSILMSTEKLVKNMEVGVKELLEDVKS